MSQSRFFVENLVSVTPNKKTGIVKINLAPDDVEDGEAGEVQLIVSAGDLQAIMQGISETMQKTFGNTPPGGARTVGMAAKKGKPGKKLKDLTKDL